MATKDSIIAKHCINFIANRPTDIWNNSKAFRLLLYSKTAFPFENASLKSNKTIIEIVIILTRYFADEKSQQIIYNIDKVISQE